MDELLDLGINSCTCRREEMGMLKAQFLSHQGEYSLVKHLVLQMKR